MMTNYVQLFKESFVEQYIFIFILLVFLIIGIYFIGTFEKKKKKLARSGFCMSDRLGSILSHGGFTCVNLSLKGILGSLLYDKLTYEWSSIACYQKISELNFHPEKPIIFKFKGHQWIGQVFFTQEHSKFFQKCLKKN